MSEKSIELQRSRLQDRFHSTPAYQVTSIGSGLQERFSRASRDTSPLTSGFLIVHRIVVGVDCNAVFSVDLEAYMDAHESARRHRAARSG